MLYCPKCRRTYQEGTVRFCTNDGGRLLPAVNSSPSTGKTAGVFSSLLGRTDKKHDMDEKLGEKPKFNRSEPPVFQSRTQTPIFKKDESENDLLEISFPNKVTGRLIKPNEIPSSNAPLGDRQKLPTGRLALTWDNPNVLLGQTVKGRYYVEEKLAQDDLSVTFLASDKILMGKRVVVKVLMDNDSDLTKQFSDARVALSHINHPNIANVFDSGELLEGKVFIISEYVEGKTLEEVLKQPASINPLRTGRIVRQISYALSEAHQNGVLHRHLNPSKIVLGVSDIGIEQVKVTDFGLAGRTDTTNIEKIRYSSPEQIENKQISYSSDTYSLAVIAYQMLTGRFPFNVNSTRELLDAQKKGLSLLPTNISLDLPTEVDAVIQKALSFNQNERYSKTREFGDALFNALNQQTVNETDLKIQSETELKIQEETKVTETANIISGVSLDALSKPSLLTKEPEKVDEYLHIHPKVEEKSLEVFEKDEDSEETDSGFQVQSTEDLAWERRSPDKMTVMSLPKLIFGGLLILALLGLLIWAWKTYLNNQDKIG
ncbi:MAG: serine/threonine protein kinase, partial [Pyrinomonadaceae bacterium]|nr:serine/threonine protein kinase [Pyrinomonadaceae bacterium]